MKKILFAMVAIAAMSACTKSEVQYDKPISEIGFAPVARNITKAALGVTDNVYPETQNIGIWSNYDGNVDSGKTVNYATQFTVSYIEDKQFTYHSDTDPKSWAGVTPYYWPTNGSLVFAGYSMTAPDAEGTNAAEVGTSREYSFSSDELKINGYTQSTDPANTFDLLWFGRTNTSHNYRNMSKAVDVEFSHALAWITIKVVGTGSVLDNDNVWGITSVVINNVANSGNVTCKGSGANAAKWNNLGTQDNSITVWSVEGNDNTTKYTNSQKLKSDAAPIEITPNGVLVIPQEPKNLTIKYIYKTPAGVLIEEESNVPLSLNGATQPGTSGDNPIPNDHTNWQSGTHYTYTLTFRQSEILISPTVDTDWATVNQGVNVN